MSRRPRVLVGSESDMNEADPQGLERWQREHSELDWLTRTLEDSLARESLALARDALDELSTVLDSHFTIEEEVYFPLIERVSDRDRSAVAAARLGHAKLRDGLEDLKRLLGSRDFRTARGDVRVLLSHLRDHVSFLSGRNAW